MIRSARCLPHWSRDPNVTRAIGALLIALVIVVRPVSGQEIEPRDPQDPLAAAPDPDRPAVTPTIQPRRLDFGVSLFDGYDLSSVTTPPGVVSNPVLHQNAGFTGVNASLSFSQAGRDNSFGAAGGTGLRYYSIAPSGLPANFFGGLNFTKKVSRHISLRGSEVASLSPFYGFSSALGAPTNPPQIVAPVLDQGAVQVNTLSSDTAVGLTWTLGPRASVTAGYSLNYVDTEDSSYRSRAQTMNGSYQYQKTRYLSLRAGYGYSRSDLIQQTSPYFASHNIDGGIGYRRPLSFSRRSIVGFSMGSTLFTEGSNRSLYLTGDASLSHQMSRRSVASFAYNRSVGRAAAQTVPYVNDTFSAAVSSLVTAKFALTGSGGYSRGGTASGSSNDYYSIYTTARASYTLSRFLPVYAEYVYYFYTFDTATGLVAGFPTLVDRHGIRGGLSYAVPLIGRRPTRR